MLIYNPISSRWGHADLFLGNLAFINSREIRHKIWQNIIVTWEVETKGSAVRALCCIQQVFSLRISPGEGLFYLLNSYAVDVGENELTVSESLDLYLLRLPVVVAH